MLLRFVEEVLPHTLDGERRLACDLIGTTMSQVGKTFSERAPTEQVERFADAIANMFCAYIRQLADHR